MLTEIFKQAWTALGRNPIRSFLTMSGISWGIVAVTLLLSYGSGFRSVLMYTFEVFGKGAVIAWPGTTSEQAGGERAGKDRKSTRLNSSHSQISYAVFCLKKKNN